MLNVHRDEDFLYKICKLCFEFNDFDLSQGKQQLHGLHYGIARSKDIFNFDTLMVNSSLYKEDLIFQLKKFDDDSVFQFICKNQFMPELYRIRKELKINNSFFLHIQYLQFSILEYKLIKKTITKLKKWI